jgi:hypothetical protein
MASIGWRFLPVRPEAMSQDPTQAEFFGPEEGSAGALVREAIQNSLDAKIKDLNGPVRVRFRFGQLEQSSLGTSPYFAALAPHLQTQFPGNVPKTDTPVSFLVVEDFGTRGLQGDPRHTIYDEHSATKENRNDFFYFWRNVGRSRKEETERGRWGLGKTVFPASSSISAFFGLTIRANDQRALLMGQLVGVTHQIIDAFGEKTIYEPYGYFAQFEEAQNLALPIEDDAFLNTFKSDFGLSRDADPGLSVVIPFPQQEVQPPTVIREAIRSYYLPILTGELVVEASNGQSTIQVHKGNVREVISKLNWKGMRITPEEMVALVDFAHEALEVSEDKYYLVQPQDPKPAPESLKTRIPEADLPGLQETFDNGELIALRVPVLVKKALQDEASHLNVFLRRDESLGSGLADFVREGLAITQTGKTPRQPVRGLAIVNDKPLSTLLGDSENPAHTKWQELSDKIKEPKYIHGRATIRLINASIQQLAEALAYRPESRDVDLLSDIFYLPSEEKTPPKPAKVQKEDELGQTETPDPTPEPSRQGIALEKGPGGFRVKAVLESGRKVEMVTIDVGYAVRSGNPFTRYRPFDFDLAKMPQKALGITVDEIVGNRLRVRVVDPDFFLSISGFDENRDLMVRAVPTYAADSE